MTSTLVNFQYDLLSVNGFDHDSDAIETVGYDREGQRLYVEFVSGGTYVFEGVAESTYNLFVGSDSLGNFFRDHIQGRFTSSGNVTVLFDEREQEKPTPIYRAGDRVEVFGYEEDSAYEKVWNGPGTIAKDWPAYENDTTVVLVNSDQNGFGTGGFDPKYIRPLAESTPEPDNAAYSRFGVSWKYDGLSFHPVFDAVDEADALRQFNVALPELEALTGKEIAAKIVSVTHYFD